MNASRSSSGDSVRRRAGDALEPRHVGAGQREPRIAAVVAIGDAELGVAPSAVIVLSSAREKCGRLLNRPSSGRVVAWTSAAPGEVGAAVDVALVVAGLAGEPAELALRRVPRRHHRREEQELADPRQQPRAAGRRSRPGRSAARRRARRPTHRTAGWPRPALPSPASTRGAGARRQLGRASTAGCGREVAAAPGQGQQRRRWRSRRSSPTRRLRRRRGSRPTWA